MTSTSSGPPIEEVLLSLADSGWKGSLVVTAPRFRRRLYLDGGELVGGCTDVFDRWKEGSLAQRLEALSIPFNPEVRDDPYSFLPGWLHPR